MSSVPPPKRPRITLTARQQRIYDMLIASRHPRNVEGIDRQVQGIMSLNNNFIQNGQYNEQTAFARVYNELGRRFVNQMYNTIIDQNVFPHL